MTTRSDEWTTLATPPWVKVISAGTLTVANGLLTTTGAGNYLVYAIDTVGIDSISLGGGAGGTDRITLDEAHGYSTGETWAVAASNGTTTEHYTATYATATAFDVAATTAADTWNCYFCKKTSSLAAEQHIQALVLASATATGAIPTIWGRWDVHGGPSGAPSVLKGYGLSLSFAASTRVLTLSKVNPTTGTFDVLASTSADLVLHEGPDGTDLQVAQWIRLIISDEVDVGGQTTGVRIRGYLNREDDGQPNLDFVDRGSNAAPMHLAGGTWAISIPTTAVYCDAFEASDAYVFPVYGAGRKDYRTLSEIRTIVKDHLSRGPASNLDDDVIDDYIAWSVEQYLDFLGDSALFMRRMETLTLTANTTTKVVELPPDVDVVIDIFSATTFEPVGWRYVDSDRGTDNRSIYMDDVPSAKAYRVRYQMKPTPMEASTDYCPIPRRWDEPVILGAVLRAAMMRRDRELVADMQNLYALRRMEVRVKMQRMKRMSKPQMRVQVEYPEEIGFRGDTIQRRGPY